jgi:methionyl-tRNA formyltransferase
VKLFGALPAVGSGEPGTVLTASDRLVVAAGSGAIAVREVQPAGRNRLPVEQWVRGRGIAAGSRFA